MHLSLKCGVITPIHTSLRDWSRCDNPYLLVDLRTLYACTIITIGTMDDSRKRPGSPGLASSTRRRRANDEINAHSSMLVAMTGAVVVVACVTSSVTHTIQLAFDSRRTINERSRRLDWEDHCEDLDEARPRLF